MSKGEKENSTNSLNSVHHLCPLQFFSLQKSIAQIYVALQSQAYSLGFIVWQIMRLKPN